jgi:MscS family membrane protein
MNTSFSWPLLAQAQGEAPAEPPVPDTRPALPGADGVLDLDQFSELVEQFVGTTFRDTPLLGWVLLLLAIFAGVVAGRLVQFMVRRLANRLESRGWAVRALFFQSLAGPANLAITTLGIAVGLASIVLSGALRSGVRQAIAFLFVLALGWFIFNLVDLVDLLLRRLTSRTQSKLDEQITPLIRKTLRLFVVIVFGLFVAQNIFGANISAWLAGLGIAGLAVSLAAQDSIKNLFGSITIFLDRPFAVGDIITFSGQTGTVEEIGFRSTRLRIFNGHVVTIPNSRIVDSDVENISRRPSIRRLLNVTITYDTPPAKVRRAVEIIRQILADPEIASAFNLEKSPPRVFFDEFNASSLNIRVMYWHFPPDFMQYLAHAEKFNLRLLEAFNAEGIDFAFPTQTLYLAGDPKRALAVHRDPHNPHIEAPGPT